MMPLGVLASGYVAPGASGLAATLTASASSASDLTTYTFSGLSIGAASATRTVIVAASALGTAPRTITGVTIGGAAATLDRASSASWYPSAMARLAVSSGTTADVVVTLSGGVGKCFVGVYAVDSALTVTSGYAGIGSPPSSGSLTTVSGGVVVAASALDSDGGPTTWSGATVDAAMLQETRYGYALSAQTTGASVTVTPAAGAGGLSAVAYQSA